MIYCLSKKFISVIIKTKNFRTYEFAIIFIQLKILFNCDIIKKVLFKAKSNYNYMKFHKKHP